MPSLRGRVYQTRTQSLGGVGMTISSQSRHRLPALTPDEDRQLAYTPPEELLQLNILQPSNGLFLRKSDAANKTDAL